SIYAVLTLVALKVEVTFFKCLALTKPVCVHYILKPMCILYYRPVCGNSKPCAPGMFDHFKQISDLISKVENVTC
uniref:Uncharacterized protein n=1 Tax=Terrapene triunguis TaxID=2587831 RepID=A0A674I812_9SAUR